MINFPSQQPRLKHIFFTVLSPHTHTQISAPTSSCMQLTRTNSYHRDQKFLLIYTILTLLFWFKHVLFWPSSGETDWESSRRRSFAKLCRAERSVDPLPSHTRQDRTGLDSLVVSLWLHMLCLAKEERTQAGRMPAMHAVGFFFFFCAQQFLETNFVPVQHKRDFLSVSTILCFCWSWDSLSVDTHTHTYWNSIIYHATT